MALEEGFDAFVGCEEGAGWEEVRFSWGGLELYGMEDK